MFVPSYLRSNSCAKTSKVRFNFIFFPLLQTNPFDLFETFFGPSMGGFSGMDPSNFGARRRSTVPKGEDIR